jgi:hypothetical protein
MSKQNFKSQAKRKRELAKLDKRTAKDQKRALKKAERSDSVDAVGTLAASTATVTAAKTPMPGMRAAVAVVPPRVPLTLAEAALRWKTTKIVKPKTR